MNPRYDVRQSVNLVSAVTGQQIIDALKKIISELEHAAPQPRIECGFSNPEQKKYKENILRTVDGQNVLNIGISSEKEYNVDIVTDDDLSVAEIVPTQQYTKFGVKSCISPPGKDGRVYLVYITYDREVIVSFVSQVASKLEILLNPQGNVSSGLENQRIANTEHEYTRED